MDLSAVVAKMGNTIREMIGANVALQLNLEREGLWVKGTPMEQVVVPPIVFPSGSTQILHLLCRSRLILLLETAICLPVFFR